MISIGRTFSSSQSVACTLPKSTLPFQRLIQGSNTSPWLPCNLNIEASEKYPHFKNIYFKIPNKCNANFSNVKAQASQCFINQAMFFFSVVLLLPLSNFYLEHSLQKWHEEVLYILHVHHSLTFCHIFFAYFTEPFE